MESMGLEHNRPFVRTIFSPLQDMTVKEFKEKVSERVGLPRTKFDLIFAGKPLVEEKNLRFYHEDYCLSNQSHVILVVVLPGGQH